MSLDDISNKTYLILAYLTAVTPDRASWRIERPFKSGSVI